MEPFEKNVPSPPRVEKPLGPPPENRYLSKIGCCDDDDDDVVEFSWCVDEFSCGVVGSCCGDVFFAAKLKTGGGGGANFLDIFGRVNCSHCPAESFDELEEDEQNRFGDGDEKITSIPWLW